MTAACPRPRLRRLHCPWAKREPYGQLLDKVVDSYGAADDKTVEIKLKTVSALLNAIGKPDSSLASSCLSGSPKQIPASRSRR